MMIEIQNIIPLMYPHHREEHLAPYIEDALEELVQLSEKLELKFDRIGIIKPKIYLIDNHDPYSIIQKQSIVFEIKVENNPKYYNLELDQPIFDNEDKVGYFKNELAQHFNDKIFHFLVLTQIAKPGSIKASAGRILVDGVFEISSHSLISIQRDSYKDVLNVKWPKIKNLPFLDVLTWFNENNFSFERYSKNSTERALNAFTRLFKDNLADIVFDLFWSLIGIEALYCPNKEGIGEQIFLKTQILLGPISDFKKRIKAMYNFRSRLIHGDLDIHPNHLYSEEDEDYEFQENLSNSTYFAVAILTATFQEMVVTNRKELIFDVVLKE